MGESKFIRHEPCECGSSDGRAVYTDHKFCFACNTLFKEETKPTRQTYIPPVRVPVFKTWDDDTYRGIPKKVLEQYGIIKTDSGVVFQYRDRTGKPIAQKIRVLTNEQK